jgi:hypothetical protein
MKLFLKLLLTILLLAFAVGVWYLVGWFISGESNPLNWRWVGKMFIVIMVLSGAEEAPKIANNIINDFDKD